MLKIAYLNGENPSNFFQAKFYSKNFGLLWVKLAHEAFFCFFTDILTDEIENS